jgi:ketosteroid isomerase-like protein
MSRQAEQTIRELTEHWNRQDTDAVVALLDEEVEVDASRRVLNPARYYGREGIRQMAREILEIWDEWTFDLGRFWWNGERAVVEGRVTARGKGSGIELNETYYAIWEMRGARPAKQIIFPEPMGAFETAGVPIPPTVRAS